MTWDFKGYYGRRPRLQWSVRTEGQRESKGPQHQLPWSRGGKATWEGIRTQLERDPHRVISKVWCLLQQEEIQCTKKVNTSIFPHTYVKMPYLASSKFKNIYTDTRKGLFPQSLWIPSFSLSPCWHPADEWWIAPSCRLQLVLLDRVLLGNISVPVVRMEEFR